MNDISKLIVGVSAGCFISFGLYYGVILKNEFEPDSSTEPQNKIIQADRNPTANADEAVFSMIYSNPESATFAYYAQKIDISKEFNGQEQFTVIVPSNDAMSKYEVSKKVPEDDVEKILQFLNAHIITEKINTAEILVDKPREYKSLAGLPIIFSRDKNGALLINGNKINAVENNGRDGIFYITDFIIDKSSVPQVLPSPSVENKTSEVIKSTPTSINN